ncbi:MAG TPA: peptide chain release factor N(5)-glutamine methyltransferase [Acidimicrobiales bacterium]
MAEVTARIGSSREAGWIVDHATAAAGDSTSVRDAASALAERRATGEPLQYVLGTWAFRSLELAVDRRVLIPRPETEQVVEVALGELARIAGARIEGGRTGDQASTGAQALVCVDLGTGSGAIALALAAEGGSSGLPLEVWATDVSPDALDVARANRDTLAVTDPEAAGRVTLAEGSWFDALPDRLARRVDLVVSNPPYVAEAEYDDLEPTVREWEPRSALVAPRGRSGVAGLADVEAVVAGAGAWLARSGALVVELAPSQAYGAIDAARRAGFRRVGTARDLAGRLRMLVAER